MSRSGSHQRAVDTRYARLHKALQYPFRPADHAEYNGGSVVRDYAGYDIVDRRYLEDRLKKSLDVFIETTGKTVYCGEYGAIVNCPRDSAIRWLEDIGSLLNERGIGRAVWSYRGFSAITSPDNESWDAEMVRAIVK